MVRLFVIDTETGGLNPDVHALLEVAALAVDVGPDGAVGQVGKPFSQRIVADWTNGTVDPEAAEVNGFDPDTWGGIGVCPAIRSFAKWCDDHKPDSGKALWCGANVSFDRAFLRCAFDQCQEAWPDSISHRSVDVQSLAFPLYACGKIEGVGMRHLRKAFSISEASAHEAMGDVLDTVLVLRELLAGGDSR